jgi:hypothetical protein
MLVLKQLVVVTTPHLVDILYTGLLVHQHLLQILILEPQAQLTL